MLRGLINAGSISVGANIFQLPDGYRPSHQLSFETITNANVYSRIYITTDGVVHVNKADAGWLSLEGIYFTAAGTVSFTDVTPFYNSWTNYTAVYGGNYANVSYGVDNIGRVHTRGLASSGTLTNSTRIASLPTPQLPPADVRILPSDSNVYAAFQLDGRAPNNGFITGYGGSTYLSLQAMFHPTNYTGWTNLTLQNSWVNYGTPFTTARYIKSADGIVSLSGLLRSGSTASDVVIATLPAGSRPSGRTLYGIASGNVAMGRIDIDTSGNIRYMAGGNAWISLDGIHFIGE